MSSHLSGASAQGQCLTIAPNATSLPVETSYVSLSYPGQIWTANDQCNEVYGNSTFNSSFCQWTSSSMCVQLFCRTDPNSSTCLARPGGAMEGTTCGSGKICINGNCTSSPIAPTDTCPFGDDIVTQDIVQYLNINLPTYQATCQQVFAIATQSGLSISGLCNNQNINTSCCQSCRKYNALTCQDTITVCPEINPNQCAGTTINGQKATSVCQRTCGTCPGGVTPQTCLNSTYVCQNGGTCVNIIASSNTLFGYKCQCPVSYTGDLCEIKQVCASNPCQNGGTCYPMGSNGYLCSCAASCSGYNCSTCTNPVPTTTTTTVITATPVSGASTPRTVTSSNIPPTTTMATTKSAPTTTVNCVDFNTYSCNYYASKNYCGLNAYIIVNNVDMLLRDACPVSCGKCSTKAPTCRQDSQSNCALWKGYCFNNNLASLVQQLCPATCGLC